MAKNEYGEAVIKWITVTVLVAVSLFFIILYKNLFVDAPTGNTEEQPTISTSPEETDNNDDDDDDDDTPIGPVITYSTFPRIAITNSEGEFYTNTGGSSNEKLKDVIDIGGYYYLILETSSNGKDYRAETQSIAVAKLDYSGTISKTLTLVSTRNETYLASKLTNSGFLVAAKGSDGITYYLINFDLTFTKAVTSDSYTEITMFYTRDFILMLGVKDRNLTVFAYNDSLNKIFSNTIQYDANICVTDIFPGSYGYHIVVNLLTDTPSSYITSINETGDLLSRVVVSNSKLLKITPIATGYALLEKSGNTIYLKGVNSSLTQQFRTAIGEGTGGDFYPLSNGYITFIYSETGTVSKHLCRFGDIITVNDYDFQDIVNIKSFCPGDDAIYFYADVISHGGTLDTMLINYNSNNIVTYSEVLGGYYQDNAEKVIIKDNIIVAFLTSYSNNTDFMGNFGGSDIFIFAKKIA